jgi:hypothetical protein
MHAMFWLHCPYLNCKQPVRNELQPARPHPQLVASHPGSQKPLLHPASHEHVALQSM